VGRRLVLVEREEALLVGGKNWKKGETVIKKEHD
jgi:hypothetical protein